MTVTEYTMGTIITDLKSRIATLEVQLRAQEAIVAADDEYRTKVKVTWDATGEARYAATFAADAAWDKCILARRAAKKLKEGTE